MLRGLVCAVVGLCLSGSVAAADPAEFSTPAAANEVLQAKGLPFALRYASEQWSLTPRSSDFRLLARVVHKESPITGVFVYRDQPSSADAVRQRARNELATAFSSYEVVGFGERVVNGMPMLYLRAHAAAGNGKELVIRGYYWIGPDGVADYSLVTSRPVFEQHREAIMGLLNGLEISSDGTGDGATG